MHSPGGTAHSVHTPFEDHYRNIGSGKQSVSKYHEAVVDLYRDGGKEAYRVLRDRGCIYCEVSRRSVFKSTKVYSY